MKKIIIHRSKDRQYYFTVVSANGEVIVTSEMYKRKQSCKKGYVALTAFFLRAIWNNEPFKIVDKSKPKKQSHY